MWATLTRVSCAYIYFGAVLAGGWLINCDTIESHNTRGSGIDQDAGPSFWLGDLDDGVVTTAVSIQGCFATGGAIQGVAYGMMSFHGGYNEWHILLPCEVAQCDWYHRHMLNYAFGTGGMTMSYCYFVVVQYWETRGYFWKRSVSLSSARCLGSLSFCLCLVAVFCLSCFLVSADTLLSFSPILQ